MGNCLRSISAILHTKSANPPAELNILLLGLDATGKTEVVNVLAHTQRIDFAPTVGCKSDHIRFDGVAVRLTELGGAKDVRDIWKHYYQEAHGAIFLIDSTDHQRMVLARTLLSHIVLQSKLCGKPMLVVCSKQDLPGAVDCLDCCAYLDIERLANLARTPCFVATAGRNDYADLEAGMRWLLVTVLHNMRKITNQNDYYENGNGASARDAIAEGAVTERTARPPSSRSLSHTSRQAKAWRSKAANSHHRRPNSAPSRERQRWRNDRRIAPLGGDAMAADVATVAER